MGIGIVLAAYVAATVLIVLSIGGLSGQESAKYAICYGIVGAALALLAIVFGPGIGCGIVIFITLVIGGVIGAFTTGGRRPDHAPGARHVSEIVRKRP